MISLTVMQALFVTSEVFEVALIPLFLIKSHPEFV